MTHKNLSTIANTVTRLTSAMRNGRFFAEEAERLHGMEQTFSDTAVRAAQFGFLLDVEGMDAPIQAYAVVTKAAEGYELELTRDENYLAEHAE